MDSMHYPTMRDICTAIMDAAVEKPSGFTTDDVAPRLKGYYHPYFDPREVGVAFRKLKRDGRITPTSDFSISRDPICHGRPKRVWVLA